MYKIYCGGKTYVSISRSETSAYKYRIHTDALKYLENKDIIRIIAKTLGARNFEFTTPTIDDFKRRRKPVNVNDFRDMMNAVTVFRNGSEYCKIKALHVDSEKKFDFPPNEDYRPQKGDVISCGGREFTISEAYESRPFDDALYSYVGSYKQNLPHIKAGDTFNIHGNVSGSIIGSQKTATINNIEEATSNLRNIIQREVTDPNDKQLLEKMTTYIEMMIENNQPMQKGTLAKFNDVLIKYAPVLTGVGNLIIQWLKS